MRDELKGKSSRNESLVLNLDDGIGKGTHWTCLFVNNNVGYCFDSFGLKPPLEILNYCKNCNEIKYCDYQIQKINEFICGQYSVYVIYKLFNGFDFFNIVDRLYKKKL